jgi:hypothetical protein
MLTEPATTANDGTWKVVRDWRGDLAFDLRTDPLGLRPVDLAGLPAPARRALLSAVDAAAAETPPATQAPGAAPTADVDVDELEAQLRLLGYL